VGTVSISIVQSAMDVPFPADVTTSRFISLGISEAVILGVLFPWMVWLVLSRG